MQTGNASNLEILSTIMMSIAFVGTMSGLIWLAYKYHYYRKPRADGTRANGTAQLIFAQSALLYIALGLLSGLLLGLSIMGLFTPAPVRQENQEASTVVGAIYIGLALLVDLCVVANLFLTTRIETAIRGVKGRARKVQP